MGVDHTAFAFYGVKLDCGERDQDAIDSAIPSSLRVSILDWGARPYGGGWGYALALSESYKEVDFDRGVGVRALPNDRDWLYWRRGWSRLHHLGGRPRLVRGLDWDRASAVSRLQDAVYALKKAGIDCGFDGEPGWFVGGRTW